jgi:hypothetical protein
MCLLCPDNPLMNASRHVVELVGDELEQVEFVGDALEEAELPVLEVLTAIVAEVGAPKTAAPVTEVNARPKLLPAAVALTATDIVFAELSPSAQLTVPLVEEKSAPAVAVPLTVV